MRTEAKARPFKACRRDSGSIDPGAGTERGRTDAAREKGKRIAKDLHTGGNPGPQSYRG